MYIVCKGSLAGLLLVLVKFALFLGGGVLVLLVLRHQVIHVALSLSELHLVHTFACVPVEEGLATEHCRELLRNALKKLLDGGAVADEGGSHFKTTWWDIAHGCLHVVRDPFDEVAAVLVLHVEDLLVHLLHGHTTTEDGGHSKIAAMAGVAGGHHVLGVEHLLSQLWDGQGPVLLAATGRERGEAGHEEVETREGHHVDGQLAEISVQLPGEA